MKLIHKDLHEKITEINLGDKEVEVKDTTSDWIILDSNAVILAVFDKFSTVSLYIEDEREVEL